MFSHGGMILGGIMLNYRNARHMKMETIVLGSLALLWEGVVGRMWGSGFFSFKLEQMLKSYYLHF